MKFEFYLNKYNLCKLRMVIIMRQPVVSTIYQAIDAFAPFASALPYDNAGLLVGDGNIPVTGVALGLDLTCELIEYAHSQRCNLIITHHPVIFQPVRRISVHHPVYQLARYGMNAICAHTNLDAAAGGVNDVLAQAIGLEQVEPLADPEFPNHPPIARIGWLAQEQTAHELASHVRMVLSVDAVGYADAGRRIRRVAVCGGAGGDLIAPALSSGAQALITADLRHHELLDAVSAGLTVLDGGHFATERLVMRPLCERLSGLFAETPMHLFEPENPLRFAT